MKGFINALWAALCIFESDALSVNECLRNKNALIDTYY